MSELKPVKFGVIGCGAISNAYFEATKRFPMLEITACADIMLDRAQAKAAEHNVPNAYTVEQMIADPNIDIVINLTIPVAHYDVTKAALLAGKHVHVEKPLTVTRAQGKELLEIAKEKGLRIGCAPDTFLGGGYQMARKLIDDGAIGTPVSASAQMLCRGHESWHPAPEFYYKAGGGPMFDMGPYYLTALVHLLGPIKRVTGSTRTTFAERTITSQPLNGTKITVETPTHISGVLDFASGVMVTLTTSFDVHGAPHHAPILLYGTDGVLALPDPNSFGGPISLWTPQTKEWVDVPIEFGYQNGSRGVGAADIAYAIRTGRPHRVSGDLAYHVLEAMWGFHDASDSGTHYAMQSTVERPAALPLGLEDGQLDS
jgi:predicted dehydrogenase